jgi:cell shape-determining protein MreC
MEKDNEVKTTLYNHMKEQIDSIKDENIRLSEKLRVEFSKISIYLIFLGFY